MGLIHVRDSDGNLHRVHTSAVAPIIPGVNAPLGPLPLAVTRAEFEALKAKVAAMSPDEPEEPDAPPPADSGAAFRDAVEADEDQSIREGEQTDRFGIA
jgi:hypothetical protein